MPGDASDAPAPSVAAMSAGGGPNVGLPTRLTESMLGLGRLESDRTAALDEIFATGDGDGAANFGGLDAGLELNPTGDFGV